MRNFFDWITENRSSKPWLIVGKGPSFSKLQSQDISSFRTIALNHSITNVAAEICHIIDIDVLQLAGDAILHNAEFLLLPYYPHINNKVGKKTLPEFIVEIPILRTLSEQNRLLWYNASTSKIQQPGSPTVTIKYFSADAVVTILAMTGESTIWSVGIDGGQSYNNTFSALNDKTLLANSRQSFNIQFIAIASSLEKYGAKLIPLGENTIKVFVGAAEGQWLATRVLEHSILIRTSASVKVMSLHDANIKIPLPKEKKNQPRTPFSFQRFLIPELCEFEGSAIYVDSDMQVFTDIRDLANREMGDQQIMNAWEAGSSSRKPQFSVMLLNCEALKNWDINHIVVMLDEGDISYEELMYEMKLANFEGQQLEREWNSLEFYEHGKTKLLHYTDMNSQPWLSRYNPRGAIWAAELLQAVKDGFITLDDVIREIHLGNVRPTLLYQIKTKLEDARNISLFVSWIDFLYTPPHKQKRWYHKSPFIKKAKGGIAAGIARLFAHIYKLFHR